MKPLFAFVMLIISIAIVKSVLISPTDENITDKILAKFKDGPKKQLFKAYHFLFQKKYDLNSQEGVRRYKNFKQMVKYIDEVNSKNLSHKAGINQFTDWTNEEFKNWVSKGYVPEVDNMEFDVTEENTKSSFLPEQTHIDWKGSMSEVRDQGDCGSCWAFATAAAIEGNYNLKYNQTYIFAPQDLIDCDTNDKACDGGSPKNAMSWIAKNGLSLESDYPYSGIANTCNAGNKNYLIEGVDSCSPGSCTRSGILERLAKGPVVTTMDASSVEFQTYKSGILDPPCSFRNHAVMLVGYNESEGFYEVRNSWASSWGENGYYRIKRNDSNQSCYHEFQGYLPKLYPLTTSAPKACVRLYPQANFEGTPYEICDSLGTLSGFNGLVSSVANIYSETVYFYSGGNCSGSTYIFSADNSNLSLSSTVRSMTNNVKSVTFPNRDPVDDGCIKVYDDSCYGTTNFLQICENKDQTDLSSIGWSARISSIKLNKGTAFSSITVYTGPNFSGTSSTISSNRPSLTSTFENKIFSIKFNK